MSSFLYKKIWHGISIHTRKCIPEKALLVLFPAFALVAEKTSGGAVQTRN